MTKKCIARKVEINPTAAQAQKINQTLGVCQYIYNLYITVNKERHEAEEPYMNAYTFHRWLNNVYLPEHPELSWIKDVSSKSVKQAIINADAAFKKFFKGEAGFPKYKKRRDTTTKMHGFAESPGIYRAARHRIKIPTLGYVRLKEFGYLPVGIQGSSGAVSRDAGRYYVTVIYKVDEPAKEYEYSEEGIGIDLGITNLAICSNGDIFANINKSTKIRKLKKRLKRQSRSLSRKIRKNKKKGKGKNRPANIDKEVLRIQRTHRKLRNARREYVRFVVNSLVSAHNLPLYVSIEDLNVSGMMKNKHLSEAIQEQMWYYFRQYLTERCEKYGVELRIVDRFYPSSKLCHKCGMVKTDLKLKDRSYKCACGNIIDRDYQAALNLRDSEVYKVA